MSARTLHPFPARMAPEIAMDSIPQSAADKLSILDPMCGSGTVLTIAAQRGHKAHGRDTDPLAVLMTKVATARLKVDELSELGETIVARAARSTANRLPWADAETIAFANYWFGDRQQTQLIRICKQIDKVSNARARSALQIALSRTIVTKTPCASLAADTSHSRPHRVLDTSDYDVYDGFAQSTYEVAKLLGRRSISVEASVHQGDARRLVGIPRSSVDLVVTSPPYLNAIDYMRGHKMSLVWFGYTISELRNIRASAVGTERALPPDKAENVRHLMELYTGPHVDQSDLPTGIIARYCHDLVLFSSELAHAVKLGGKVVLVIGNSNLKGKYIRNDLLVEHSFASAGFSCTNREERDLPENLRYLPISTKHSSPIAKRMRTEVILTMIREKEINDRNS
jgi:hypothetical protein